MDQVKRKLILTLFDIGAVKFGEFTYKSGLVAPNYIDHRLLISHPQVLKQVAKAYLPILVKLKFDRMAAVPYGALPIVTAISLLNNKPWVFSRKEAKAHGLKKLIEGEFNPGEKIVLIDDLISLGDSKFEAILPLKKAGLKVKDVVVLIDRGLGGKKQLKEKGYRLHSIVKFSEVLKVLLKNKRITKEEYKISLKFIKEAKGKV